MRPGVDPGPRGFDERRSSTWCLLEEALEDGMCRPERYWDHWRARGVQEGWLTKAARLQALQMFVLFDRNSRRERALFQLIMQCPWQSYAAPIAHRLHRQPPR